MRNMTIRSRLFWSYFVVLGSTLFIITIALIFFLAAQPASPLPLYQNLSNLVRDFLLTALPTGNMGFNRLTLNELGTTAQQFATENAVRLIGLNRQTNRVLFDSSGVLAADTPLALAEDTTGLPRFLPTRMGMGFENIVGRFTQPDGQTWLFVGIASLRNGTEQGALIAAQRLPPRNFRTVWGEFWGALFVPISQASLVGLLVALLMAAAISARIGAALRLLIEGTRHVAAGNYRWRIAVDGSPEIRALGAAFNTMSDRVASTQQAQQDFLANVSHDLKTPLTSIQGYAQAIVDGAAKDPAHAAQIIHDEAARMNRLVNELTDLARLEAGQFSLNFQTLDLNTLLNSLVQRLSIVAEQKGLRLQSALQPLPPVTGDGDRLAQVFTNLLGNALHYTPNGGQVWLTSATQDGGVLVSVQDTGIGLPAHEIDRIFERFYQVDKARGPQRGTGLGLAIAQQIVTAHGGRIHAASAGVNQGSTFSVWLPLHPEKSRHTTSEVSAV